MRITKIASLLLLLVLSSACAQNRILSIKDALRITKMRDMEEASAFLLDNGYTETRSDRPFYSRDVATFWVKGCEADNGTNAITTTAVNGKSSSSVSVLASEYDRWIEICVHDSQAKDRLLRQMEELKFQFVRQEEDGEDIYANGADTIIVRKEDRITYNVLDQDGNKRPYLYSIPAESDGDKEVVWMTNAEWEDYLKDDQEWYSQKGFELIRKDGNGFVYKKDGTELRVEKYIDENWDGNYTFTIPHDTHWSAAGKAEEYLGPDEEELMIWDEPNVMVEEEMVEEEMVEDEPIPFQLVSMEPRFSGDNFSKWAGMRIEYPEKAIENRIQGKVRVKFTVGPDGKVSQAEVLQSPDPVLSEEVVKVVASSPKWVPGKQTNRSAKVMFELPVVFSLQGVSRKVSGENPVQGYSSQRMSHVSYVETGGTAFDDQMRIEGFVLDAENHSPVIGAAIYDPDNKIGTISGINGEFDLDVLPSTKRISVVCIGYETVSAIPVGTMHFYLVPSVTVLDEVQVVAD